jgi:iron complex transport system substrate-binding protein
MLGGMIGGEAATALAGELEQGTPRSGRRRRLSAPARVYFGRDEPQISCIRWVSELIGIAGMTIFSGAVGARSAGSDSRRRSEAARRAPDIIFGSWCGKEPAACGHARLVMCRRCGRSCMK